MTNKRDAKVTKVFMTTGGKMFDEVELKKYEIPQTRQFTEEGKWAVDVIDPPYNLLKLMSWLDISVIHSSCVRVKVQDAVGIGWKLKEVEGEKPTDEDYSKLMDFFNKCNEEEDITSVCKKVMLDYEACGNGYFEVVRDPTKEEGIKALYHVNATTIRLTKDKEKWVQKIGINKVYFKKWGDPRILNKETGVFSDAVDPDMAGTELIQLKQHTYRSSYYGLPEWLPALFQMYGEMKEKEYNLDFFSNHGIPAYAVILEGVDMDADLKKEIQAYFETEIKRNPHRTMIFSTPEGATVKFERLSVEAKEASFRVYRKDNRDDVLTAHHVPPYRASIIEKGQLGGTVAEDVDRIYLDSVINPRQRDFTWVINELLLWEGFQITSFAFEFLDIDIRDKKVQAEIDQAYFNMGARTANEILVAEGKEPYEGGDVYYVPANLVPIGTLEAEKIEKRKVFEKLKWKRSKKESEEQ